MLIYVTHPGQSKVHLHLRQSLPHTGSHPDTEGDEAVRVMLVGARRRPDAATAGHLRTEPPLGEEELCVYKLCFTVTGCVMTKVELSLKGRNNKSLFKWHIHFSSIQLVLLKEQILLVLLSYLLWEPVFVHNHLVL